MRNKFLKTTTYMYVIWIVLILLKACDYINVSWWWIGLPVWLFIGTTTLMAIVFSIVFSILALILLYRIIKGD